MVLNTKIANEPLAGKDHRGDTRIRKDAAFTWHQLVYESWLPGVHRPVEMQNEFLATSLQGSHQKSRGVGVKRSQVPMAL